MLTKKGESDRMADMCCLMGAHKLLDSVDLNLKGKEEMSKEKKAVRLPSKIEALLPIIVLLAIMI